MLYINAFKCVTTSMIKQLIYSTFCAYRTVQFEMGYHHSLELHGYDRAQNIENL